MSGEAARDRAERDAREVLHANVAREVAEGDPPVARIEPDATIPEGGLWAFDVAEGRKLAIHPRDLVRALGPAEHWPATVEGVAARDARRTRLCVHVFIERKGSAVIDVWTNALDG